MNFDDMVAALTDAFRTANKESIADGDPASTQRGIALAADRVADALEAYYPAGFNRRRMIKSAGLDDWL